MCRAPVACFGSVYMHASANIAACIVCIVLFVIMIIRQQQRRSIGKTSAGASDTKGRIAQRNRLQGGRLAWVFNYLLVKGKVAQRCVLHGRLVALRPLVVRLIDLIVKALFQGLC